MSAMVWSFILSRTLVPTMAKYMLHKHVARTEGTARRPPPPSRNPLVRLQRGFEPASSAHAAYREMLGMALRIARPS